MKEPNHKDLIGRIKQAGYLIPCFTLIIGLILAATPSRTQAQTERPESTQAVFTNSTPIDVSAAGPAANGSPYPSPIVVSGLSGNIPTVFGSVKVTIKNFSHQFSGDVGFVLVGPTGAALMLQNNIGFGSVTNVTYTLSDASYQHLFSTIGNGGIYGVGSQSSNGSFPAPGPLMNYNSGPYVGNATFASTFGGTNPNGTWNLYTRNFYGGTSGSIAGGWSLEINTGLTPNSAVLDFDGDGKTDYGLVRNSSGNLIWHFLSNAGGYYGVQWGLSSDSVIPGDFDGDGKWDVGYWRSGTFFSLRSSGTGSSPVQFGQSGDDPRITQDFDGDGKADPAVVRAVGGNLIFYILRSTLGFTAVQFGLSTIDVGIRGDFDGDGKADVAVYRTNGSPANTFFILPSGGGPLKAVTFGDFNTDYIVPADFDGDHKTDIAVWRGIGSGSSGTWYWLRSSDGAFKSAQFGVGNLDRPAPGDYDGDGKTDLAVFRPQLDGIFYSLASSTGVMNSQGFGTAIDLPPAFTLQVR
jgi:hypothetical protein